VHQVRAPVAVIRATVSVILVAAMVALWFVPMSRLVFYVLCTAAVLIYIAVNTRRRF